MARLTWRMRTAESWRGNRSSEKGFLERGYEVSLQPGWPWQSRLSGLKSQGGWTVHTLAAERNDQNGIDSFADITGVERNYQDPMAGFPASSSRSRRAEELR